MRQRFQNDGRLIRHLPLIQRRARELRRCLLLSSLIISRLGAYLFPVEHPIAPAESRSLSPESVT